VTAVHGPEITDVDFQAVFDRMERAVEERYGVPVRVRDVPDPFFGDLDGAEIHVDWDNDAEAALFLLVHLFGHTVQWNLSPRARELSTLQQRLDGPPSPELRRELQAFELEACEYSLQLLHEVGVTELDQWVADYAACDFAYLMHFYDTGETAPFRSFWRSGSPRITPRPIPPFEPTRWITRWQGIVV
jgi:hypothetical protein